MPCLSLNYLWSKKTPVQYTEEEEEDSILCWIESFLSQRKQSVLLDGTESTEADVQYTKRGFTIFHVGFGVATLCLAQSRWFHGDGHREFQVNQRDSQRDEERGVIIDFREMGCFIATPCLFVSGREIPCLYVSEREIYDLLFTFAISAHGSKVQLTAYALKPS